MGMARLPWGAPSRGRARGLSLLELILVMGILGLVFGSGIAILTSLDLTSSSGAGLVRTALSAASNAALREGAPARLEVDSDGRTLWVVAPRAVGTWHFEEPTGLGARGLTARWHGARPIEDGHLGRALQLAGGGDDAHVELGLAPGSSLDLSDGFAVELAVRLEGLSAGRLFDLAGVAGVDLLPTGQLRGWVRLLGEGGAGGVRRDVESGPNPLALGRWSRVALHYDRVELRLWVDGSVLALVTESSPLDRGAGRLVLGGAPRPIQAAVDSLVVRQADRGEPLRLPDSIAFAPESPRLVRFGADGAPDRASFGDGVKIELLDGRGQRETLSVTPYGAVR